jgi:excisionase family DNA binding protein
MNPAENNALETLLTLAESSKLLRVSIRQIYRLIAEGKIPVVMVGRRSPRLRPSDLREYLEACTVQHGI